MYCCWLKTASFPGNKRTLSALQNPPGSNTLNAEKAYEKYDEKVKAGAVGITAIWQTLSTSSVMPEP